MHAKISNKPYQILNRDIIKYIAMFTMLLNHIATIFLSSGTWLCESFLAIGYFTAITMTYFLVEGYHYTHSKKIYICICSNFGDSILFRFYHKWYNRILWFQYAVYTLYLLWNFIYSWYNKKQICKSMSDNSCSYHQPFLWLGVTCTDIYAAICLGK